MVFRPLHPNEKPPKCDTCGSGAARIVPVSIGISRWVCATCEYRERFPAAPLIPAAPYARRALPLQKEVLF